MDACPSLAEQTNAEYLLALNRQAEARGIPLSASVELTERCNLGCVHCYLGDQAALRPLRSRELDTGRWRAVLDDLVALGCLRLLVTGGEPLLRADFGEIYRHARLRGLLVTVFTNGTLVGQDTIELFRELPPSAVEVTLYGATAETYEAVTGVPGSFQRCLEGIEGLQALGLDLCLKTVLLRQNRHEFPRIAALARERGNRRFRFDIEIQAGFDGDPRPKAARLTPEEAVELEFSDPEAAASWRAYHARRKGQVPSHPERLYGCSAGRSSIHVNPYGRLQPCLAMRHLGFDLARGSLVEGLASLREWLDGMRTPGGHPCHGCEARMICSSCPAFARAENGCEERPADYQCRVARARLRLVEPSEGA